MPLLFYVRLIGFTAGTLVTLFLLALIVGHRRPRAFERVLFFLLLALFLFYAGGLLIFNTQMHYVLPPAATWSFGMGLIAAGLALLPPLLLHAHVAYERVTARAVLPAWLAAIAWGGYLPLLYFLPAVFPLIIRASSLDVLWPGSRAAHIYGFWLGAVLVACARFELASARRTQAAPRSLHRFLVFFCLFGGVGVIYLSGIGGPGDTAWSVGLGTIIVLSAVVPCAALGYAILRHNFLEIGLQRNLV